MGKEVDMRFPLIVVSVALLVVLILNSSPTGFFVVDTNLQQKVWDFNESGDYSFDETLINFSGSEIKLLPQIS